MTTDEGTFSIRANYDKLKQDAESEAVSSEDGTERFLGYAILVAACVGALRSVYHPVSLTTAAIALLIVVVAFEAAQFVQFRAIVHRLPSSEQVTAFQLAAPERTQSRHHRRAAPG
jgi:hypothetical protein